MTLHLFYHFIICEPGNSILRLQRKERTCHRLTVIETAEEIFNKTNDSFSSLPLRNRQIESSCLLRGARTEHYAITAKWGQYALTVLSKCRIELIIILACSHCPYTLSILHLRSLTIIKRTKERFNSSRRTTIEQSDSKLIQFQLGRTVNADITFHLSLLSRRRIDLVSLIA